MRSHGLPNDQYCEQIERHCATRVKSSFAHCRDRDMAMSTTLHPLACRDERNTANWLTHRGMRSSWSA